MEDKFVLFVMGEDRPGIVTATSEVLYKNKFNIEDSSMTILEGHFSMVLIISSKRKYQIPALRQKFQRICKKLNLIISVKRFSPVSKKVKDDRKVEPYIISLIGSDKVGIVHKITKLIAGKNINITDVRTEIIGEEKSPFYTMILEIEKPEDIKVSKLRSDLRKLGKELNVDINIKPINVLETLKEQKK